MLTQIAILVVYGSMRLEADFTKIKTVHYKGKEYDWWRNNDFNGDLGLPIADAGQKRQCFDVGRGLCDRIFGDSGVVL